MGLLFIDANNAFKFSDFKIKSIKPKKEILPIFCLIICLVIAIILQSRAFALGYSVAIAAIFFSRDIFKIQTKTKKLVVISLLILILPITFFLKVDSSLGRLLIYKINLGILKEHYLTGVGINHYNVTYSHYQALYFKAGHYSQKELLLADNVRYAFNDYLQFVIETGFLGFLAVLLFLFCVVILCHKMLCLQNANPPSIILFFTGQIIAFSLAALFRPVFYQIFFLAIFLVSLIVVISYYVFTIRPLVKAVVANVLIVGGVLLFYYGDHIRYFKNYETYEQVKDLCQAGYLNESLQIFDSLYPNLENDYLFLDTYSTALVRANNYDKAIPVVKQAMKLSNSISLCIRLANCYYKIGKLKQAEKYYLTAVCTVPNRFRSRFYLYNFYKETNQLEKAVETGKDILDLPVKVPSLQVEQIKQTIRYELNAGTQNTNKALSINIQQ